VPTIEEHCHAAIRTDDGIINMRFLGCFHHLPLLIHGVSLRLVLG